MKKIQLTALLLLFSMILPLTTYAAGEDSAIPDTSSEATPHRETEDAPDIPIPPTTAPETVPETSPDDPLPPPILNKATLVAQTELRAGESATFHLHLSSENARAIQGSILFDNTILTLEECKTTVSDWNMSFSVEDGSIEYLGLNTMGEGLTGENDLIVLTFRVSKEVTIDHNSTFTVTPPVIYNGEEEITYEGDSPTFPIAPPFSTDCALNELKVEGGAIFPAFAPDITEYSVTLPFAVETATITAIANDQEFATVKVGNTTLAVGTNTVDITVISQAGLQQVYTITITRSPDPNYKPSADNRILALTLTEGLLFPSFSPDVTKYSIYMVRGQEVSVHPIPTNKAVASTLHIPDDTDEIDYTIVCTAENGTTRQYVFHVILLETPKQLEKLQKENSLSSTRDQLRNVFFIAIGITLFFLGFVFGALFLGKRKKSSAMNRQSEPELPIVAPPVPLSPPAEETPPAPPVEAPAPEPTLEEAPADLADSQSAKPETAENKPAEHKPTPKTSGSHHNQHKHKQHKKKHKHKH